MTERTLSGRTRRRAASAGKGPRFRLPNAKKKRAPGSAVAPADENVAPVLWAFGMLVASLFFAAAAVFTHRVL